jgi:hypothetical protein
MGSYLSKNKYLSSLNTETSKEAEGFDYERMAKGAQFFRRNYFSIFVSMLTGLLSLMYVESIVRVLHLTRRSHTPVLAFTRYLGTLNHAVKWFQGPESLQTSLRHVLQLHRAAALRTRRSEDDPSITQFDMVVTQWAFIGIINTSMNNIN